MGGDILHRIVGKEIPPLEVVVITKTTSPYNEYVWSLYRRCFFMVEVNQVILKLLNFSVNEVDFVNLIDNEIFIKQKRQKLSCPICNSNPCYSKGYYSKTMKVSNELFQEMKVHLSLCRYQCLKCSHSFTDNHHSYPTKTQTSYSLIIKVMKLLKDPKTTFKRVSELTGLSQTTVVRIFDKYCHVKRASLPAVLCIDEVYTKQNSYDSKYSFVMYDFIKHTMVDVTPCRRLEYLNTYFQKIPEEERNNVQYVCMDMYHPYKRLIKRYFKKANICVDSFHVIKSLNDSLDKLRIRVMKTYPTDSIEYYLLKQWKNLLFDKSKNLDNHGKYNKKLKRVLNYRQLLELILDCNEELRLAYRLADQYTLFNATSNYEQAKEKLDYFENIFKEANISEFYDFTTALSNWKLEIGNSFIYYKGKRINNSVAESLNAIVSCLLSSTKGMKNNDRRRKRTIYAINKEGFTIQ